MSTSGRHRDEVRENQLRDMASHNAVGVCTNEFVSSCQKKRAMDDDVMLFRISEPEYVVHCSYRAETSHIPRS